MHWNTNFDERPFIAIWETRACDPTCVHCLASTESSQNPCELNTAEAKRLIDEIATMEVPVFVLTGGDPLKRPDIFELVQYGASQHVRISLTSSATSLLTRDSIVRLKKCNLSRLAISLDGPTADVHDVFRGVPGSFQRALDALRWAREIGLPVQINTTVTRHNLEVLDDIIDLLDNLDILAWNVFFPVPDRRGSTADLLSALEFEQAFEKLYHASQRVLFDITTNEAQHYRRYLLQRHTQPQRLGQQPSPTYARIPQFLRIAADAIAHAPGGINAGKGSVFVSYCGEIYPSGFLPLSAGNLRRQSLADIYCNSQLFRKLRDSRNLEGKCGACEYREICGGSRARSFAVTGDMFAEDSSCVYERKCQADVRDEAEPVAV